MLAAVLAAAVASGCGVSQLAFVTDTRLHIFAPKSLTLVTLPVTLRWTIRDFTIAGPSPGSDGAHTGYFAIFVDRAPVRPGQTLRAVVSGDNACLHTPGCPTAQYLADRQVYTTTNTYFTLTTLTSLSGYQKVQLHEATIVLMDPGGHRVGESAWYVDFRVRQEDI